MLVTHFAQLISLATILYGTAVEQEQEQYKPNRGHKCSSHWYELLANLCLDDTYYSTFFCVFLFCFVTSQEQETIKNLPRNGVVVYVYWNI